MKPYESPYPSFQLKRYQLDDNGTATFQYEFAGGPEFIERIDFGPASTTPDKEALEAALFYVFVVLGLSYYKLYPAAKITVEQGVGQQQAKFFNQLYREGLGEFLYVNKLLPDSVGSFVVSGDDPVAKSDYQGDGLLLLQSGGKDSLLAADLLASRQRAFTPWHLTSTGQAPLLLREEFPNLQTVQRHLDLSGIEAARKQGGLNGHVPFSAILAGLALVSAVRSGQSTVIAANEWSANEPTANLPDGTPVNHQYSKSYTFEQLFQNYVTQFIAKQGLSYGSVLRPFSELRINELFVSRLWERYGHRFSSCNRVNYKQGQDNSHLNWCGDCPKCANSFLLMAPFVKYEELVEIFGADLFQKASLQADFRGLLGLSDAKPFECVGEIEELQLAYHMAREHDQRFALPFEVPRGQFDYRQLHDHQPLFDELVDYASL